MKNTICLKINLEPFYPWSEILISQLSEMEFYSFEEKDNSVLAYCFEGEVDIDEVLNKTCLSTNDFKFSFEKEIFTYQNWNEKWEKEYDAIYIDNKVSITAPFHDKKQYLPLNILIQPQTSFGTGHHPTTQLVISSMLELNPFPKKVLDMGTGTGVLAILSEKLGAEKILAVDIEDWSIENTKNNAKLNFTNNISFLCGDIDILNNEKFSLILANINKNILKKHIPYYTNLLSKNGILILSGILESDIEEMKVKCEEYELMFLSIKKKDSWVCLKFIKK